MYDKTFIKWVLQISLQSLGIFDDHLYSMIFCVILTVAISISIFGSVIGFLNSTTIIDRIESFTTISPQLTILLMYLSVNTSRENLLDLLAKVQSKNENHNVSYMMDQTNSSIKSKLTWLAIIMVIQTCCFTIPVWIFSLQQDTIDDKYSLIIPYWFSCGNQNSRNVLQSVCWRIKNKNMLFAINTLQMGGVFTLNIVYFAAFSLYMTIVEELVKHVECIRNSLRRLSERIHEIDSESMKFESNRFTVRRGILNENVYKNLLLSYNHQQFLNRFILKTISTWKGFITFFYINFGINMTLFIFVIFYEIHSDKLLVIKVALLGSTLFAMAFIVANYAQQISHMKEEIFNELSNVPWYEMNIKYRKIYLSMLTLNCTLVPVKIADMYEINMNSFGDMVKAAYSICNMLLLKFVK